MAPRKSAGTRPIFAGCVVAQAGDLGRSGWKEADVERWVTAWGGVFAGDLSNSRNSSSSNNHHDADITHILATQAQFKDRKNARVARARKMRGKDAPHFVTADWLEDCISARRRLPEREFSLRERQRKEDAKRRRAERAEKGIEKGKRLVNDCINHVYSDSTFFRYDIELTRNDKESGNVGQKYQICIWESNAVPHHYQMTARYFKRPGDSQPAVHRFPENSPTFLGPVFDHFKHFFRLRTKIDWDDRVEKAGSRPAKDWQYRPPTGGKPVGLIRGEPPTIFGDGKNIVIHRDEDSDREHHGDDTCNDGNAPATSIPSLPPPAPEIQVSSNSGAAGGREENDIAVCAQEGGEDDGDEEMRDVSAQQEGSDDCAKDGEQAEDVNMA